MTANDTTGMDDTLVAMLSAFGHAGFPGQQLRERFSFDALSILVRATYTPEEKFHRIRALFLTGMDTLRNSPEWLFVDDRDVKRIQVITERIRNITEPLPNLYAGFVQGP